MSAETTACALSIAGLTVAVTCDQPALAGALQRRYAGFPARGAVLLTVQVDWAGQSPSAPDPDPKMSFHEHGLTLDALQFTGSIDRTTSRAHLRLDTAFPLEGVEYFLRIVYAWLVFQRGGLMAHAAGILRAGKVCLFVGRSGSGKTTVSRVSTDAQVLNDDLIVLLPDGAVWQAYATPFWNPTQVAPAPLQGPLAGIFRLVQDRQVYLEPMTSGQALAELISSIPVISADPTRQLDLLARGARLLQAAPAYRLHFLPDASFWRLIDPLL